MLPVNLKIVKRGFAWFRASGSFIAIGRNRADAGFFSE
jgi:hypothetical protein